MKFRIEKLEKLNIWNLTFAVDGDDNHEELSLRTAARSFSGLEDVICKVEKENPGLKIKGANITGDFLFLY